MTLREKLLIEQVISEFDFEKVEKAMKVLEWFWAIRGDMDRVEIPSLERIKSVARRIMTLAINEKTSISSGGFEAKYEDGVLELKFVIEDARADINEDLNQEIGECEQDI